MENNKEVTAMASEPRNYPDYVFVAYDEDFSAQTYDIAVSLEPGNLVGRPVKYIRHDLNTRPAPAATDTGLNYYTAADVMWSLEGIDPVPSKNGQWVKRSQAEKLLAAAMKDRLPDGHTILEQADTLDGRVSQTVRVDATGEEYERIVHADEAYGEEE